MKTRSTISFLAIVCLCAIHADADRAAAAQPDGEVTLVVSVTGLTSEKGQVRIAVFNSSETWLDEAAYAEIVDPESPTCEWTIDDVPPGEYGVAVFHDRNGNGWNDRNFLGIPKEPYGFSNNARGMFGPAKWNKAKLAVAGPITKIEIEVR